MKMNVKCVSNKVVLGLLWVLLTGYFCYQGISEYNASWNELWKYGNFIACKSGDESGYINPWEHYIQEGVYYQFTPQDTTVGRGPYYGFYYFIFRQFLSQGAALDALAILQIMCFSLSLIILMILMLPCLRYKAFVWAIPIIAILITPISMLIRIETESLVIFYLICFVYFYTKFNASDNLWFLGLAALFLGMASVMKPYLLPIYAFCFFDWVFSTKIFNIKKWITYIGVMSLPLVVICLPFTIRNVNKLHIFAPMQNTTFAGIQNDSVDAAMRKMVRVWGESHLEWENDAVGTFFAPHPNIKYTGDFPMRVLTKDYSYEDLCGLRDKIAYSRQLKCDNERDSLKSEIIHTMNFYRDSYVQEHPCWRIYASVKTLQRLISFRLFTVNHRHTGLRYIISNGAEFLIGFTYNMVVVLGFIGLLLFVKYEKRLRFIVWIVCWICLFFVYLLAGEHRFFILCEPFCMIGTIYVLDKMLCIIFNTKHSCCNCDSHMTGTISKN